jgi:very-short-patch-repair endonuclease
MQKGKGSLSTNIVQQFEIARKKLLDTSSKNRLIHYKGSKSVGAEIAAGESADHVFDLLVTKGKPMRFLGQPDQLQVETSIDVPAPAREVLANDDLLTCRESETTLKKKLLKTFRDQRTLMEETGVNTLFLAIGRLQWVDPAVQRGQRSSPLLLVPVNLERIASADQYRVTWDGQDVLQNLSLAVLFKDQFGIQLPELAINEETKPSVAFQEISRLISSKGWSVATDEMSLAFFSSAKYLMYADLDPMRWPEDLSQHHDLKVLLSPDPDLTYGDGDDGLLFGQSMDEARPVESCTEVVDCDGSQLQAIMQAARGKTMVIEGPPGTGKSQTITNLLADFVARGKTVLFVAEKQAALNVVARNLERVGLRSLCLELHSHNTNKAQFYRAIVDTLVDAGAASSQTFASAELQRVRDELNQYAAAVNKSVEGYGLTPREIMGEILKLGPDQTEGRRLPDSQAVCDKHLLAERREASQALDRWFTANGKPNDHKFKFITRFLDPVERQQLLSHLRALLASLQSLNQASQSSATLIQARVNSEIADLDRLTLALKSICERPALCGLDFAHAQQANSHEISELLEQACRWSDLHKQWSSVLKADLGSMDLHQLRSKWSQALSSPIRALNPSFYSLRKQVSAIAQGSLSTDEQRSNAIEAAVELRDLAKAISARTPQLQAAFSGATVIATDPWKERQLAWKWFEESSKAVSEGLLPDSFFALPLNIDLAAVRDSFSSLQSARAAFNDNLAKAKELGAAFSTASLTEIQSTLNDALAVDSRLNDWVAYIHLEGRLEELELQGLVEFARMGAPLDQIVARSYLERALRQVYAHPSLQRFSLQSQETLLQRFRTLDSQLLIANRERIRTKHRLGLPSGHGGAGGVGTLQREATKQRRHQPIRKTMATAWPAIQKIKPIFMMSPVSVSMYLPQDGPKFDVVIFDEASQVRPEEAIGAIARASQAIVVGDTKQMPPTSFFERMTQETEAEEDEVEEATAGLESILDVVSTRIPKHSPFRKDLRWHYRSRHETLITPSNGLFYDWRLFIVPNPAPPDQEIGLAYHHMPQAAYDRGHSRTNRAEATAVAEAIVDNLRRRPRESVMAVAFSTAQQTAIQDALDNLLKDEPALQAEYQALHPTEPVDVKNLENVQGDERDVVLISIGYGKTDQGYLSQNFGPLNQEGGGRRLNVLITRARKRCEVFTNLEPEDIKAEGNPGRHALKTFLTYARSGHMDVPNVTGREPMSVFEEQVIDALTRHGFVCEPQVGVAGFFIDIGVRHPKEPHRYCLGIECDGAQYHSSLTARDRDRLRQSVLESRGWIIHRIWSTDWFSDPQGCLERTVAAIKEACEREPQIPVPPSPAETSAPPAAIPAVPPTPVAAPPRQSAGLIFEPYQTAIVSVPLVWDYDWLLANSQSVIKAMKEVVLAESPISVTEVIRRLRESCGGGRTGSRINPLLSLMASRIVVEGHILEGEWFVPQSRKAKPRDRKHFDAPYRKPDLIHDLEIMAAMGRIVEAEVVAPRERLAKEALRLLGIGRVSQEASQRLSSLIDRSIQEGWVVETSAGLMLPKSN